jgi:hypothetical protein
MIKKFSGASLKHTLSYHNLKTAYYFCDYVIAYEYFLAKADFIHMLFPNVYDYSVSVQRWLKI